MPEEEKKNPDAATPTPREIGAKDSVKDTTEAEATRKAKAKARRQDPFDGTKRGM